MLHVSADDHDLNGLIGARLSSGLVLYALEGVLGVGGMSTAFLATRSTPTGEARVVVKVTLPKLLKAFGDKAALAIRKEAVALSRLNERTPANPFVVRFIDVNAVDVRVGGEVMSLPWLAIELVDGGAEGTSLEARITNTVKATGFAFDPDRAERAVTCIGSGLSAIHAAGVVHRDLKPANILCCGSGPDEIFKIVDFGIARPAGMESTFGLAVLGTPGYAPPEQAGIDPEKVGAWSDVYAFGSIVYYLLAGREYFAIDNPMAALMAAFRPKRPALADAPALHPELRGRNDVLTALDRLIADATASKPEARPASSDIFLGRFIGALRTFSRRHGARRASHVGNSVHPFSQTMEARPLVWSVLHKPSADRLVRKAAWGGDGRCLAATDRGVSYFDGTAWTDLPSHAYPNPAGIRFVERLSPGQWLVGGDEAVLARVGEDGLRDVTRAPNRALGARLASGDPDDLAVFLFEGADKPILYASSGGRWLKPLPLEGVAVVTALARFSDEEWLLAGRRTDGRAFAALHRPLHWEVTALPPPNGARTFLAVAAQPGTRRCLFAGLDGAVFEIDDGRTRFDTLPDRAPVGAAAIEAGGRAWLASTQRVWTQRAPGAPWIEAFSSEELRAPFVSMHADDAAVLAVTVDGAVIEGRAIPRM